MQIPLWVLKTWEPGMVRAETRVPAPAVRRRRDSAFLCLSVLSRPSVDWVLPTHVGEKYLVYSVHRSKCESLPGTPSQTHSEVTSSALWVFLGPVKLIPTIHHHIQQYLLGDIWWEWTILCCCISNTQTLDDRQQPFGGRGGRMERTNTTTQNASL